MDGLWATRLAARGHEDSELVGARSELAMPVEIFAGVAGTPVVLDLQGGFGKVDADVVNGIIFYSWLFLGLVEASLPS